MMRAYKRKMLAIYRKKIVKIPKWAKSVKVIAKVKVKFDKSIWEMQKFKIYLNNGKECPSYNHEEEPA